MYAASYKEKDQSKRRDLWVPSTGRLHLYNCKSGEPCGGITWQCNKRVAMTSSSVEYAEVQGMKAKRMRGNADKYSNGNVKKTELNIQGVKKS